MASEPRPEEEPVSRVVTGDRETQADTHEAGVLVPARAYHAPRSDQLRGHRGHRLVEGEVGPDAGVSSPNPAVPATTLGNHGRKWLKGE